MPMKLTVGTMVRGLSATRNRGRGGGGALNYL
jgi:hypothetical protein